MPYPLLGGEKRADQERGMRNFPDGEIPGKRCFWAQ
jgi:hypothetical protein